MERLPPTFLIDCYSTKQPIKISSDCTILGMQISHNGNSQKVTQMLAKIRKSQATIYLPGTSAQIYRIVNLKLKVRVLYMVAPSELKLNENSEHDEVVMYQNMLQLKSFHFRWYNLYAFVTDFLLKKPREIKRNTFSFIL